MEPQINTDDNFHLLNTIDCYFFFNSATSCRAANRTQKNEARNTPSGMSIHFDHRTKRMLCVISTPATASKTPAQSNNPANPAPIRNSTTRISGDRTGSLGICSIDEGPAVSTFLFSICVYLCSSVAKAFHPTSAARRGITACSSATNCVFTFSAVSSTS